MLFGSGEIAHIEARQYLQAVRAPDIGGGTFARRKLKHAVGKCSGSLKVAAAGIGLRPRDRQINQSLEAAAFLGEHYGMLEGVVGLVRSIPCGEEQHPND